jgi:hypothetical protein
MSTRQHFWFRIAAIAAIIFAQFGPRLWGAASPVTSGAPVRVAAATVP